MTVRHRIRFYQQLAVLARAGVPLRSSLQRLQGRFSDRETKVLNAKINAGEGIGDAFIEAGFSSFECHLVAAGERSAKLENIFQHLADFWTRQRDMREAILRPLYYPIAVLHFAIFMGAVVELTTASFPVMVFHLIVRLGLLYGIGFLLYLAVRLSRTNEIAQRLWMFVPLIGRTLSSAYAYRWITVLKLEYAAGIPMPNAIADAWRASGYVGNERLAEEGNEAMRQGVELSHLMQNWRQLPRDWIDFVETGEVSGTLETAFENLESEAARAWAQAQQRMSEWMPKILYFLVLLVVAIQVGTMIYQTVVVPITSAENAIDNAMK